MKLFLFSLLYYYKIFVHFDIEYEQIYFYNFNQDNKLYIKKILEYEYNNNRITN